MRLFSISLLFFSILFILLEPYRRKYRKKEKYFPKQIMLTFVVHIIALGLYAVIFAMPTLTAFIKDSEVHIFGGLPLKMPLLLAVAVLPTILIALIWIPSNLGITPLPKGKILKLIGFWFWIMLNWEIFVLYMVVTAYYFN